MFATVNNMRKCAEQFPDARIVMIDPIDLSRYSADAGDYFMHGENEHILNRRGMSMLLARVTPEQLEDIPEHLGY